MSGGRLARIDVLRGLAVFGILLVNIWAFAWGLSNLRYGMLAPAAGAADQAAVFGVAWLAEQKFYPIFAFLFGAGLALQTRTLRRATGSWPQAQRRYRRRLLLLLACGLGHGLLVWSGDVLSFYAVGGLLLLALAPLRLRRLRLVFFGLLIFLLLSMLANLLMYFAATGPDTAEWSIRAFERGRGIYSEGGWGAIARRRAADFWESRLYGLAFFLPHAMLVMLAGMFAVRLGWLSRPARHRVGWVRIRRFGLGLGLPLNLMWAWVVLTEAIDPRQQVFNTAVWSEFLDFFGPCLAAGYVACVMLACGRVLQWGVRWLAPVGRMALSNYLLQSLLGTLLLQGAGFGFGAAISPAGLVGCALLFLPVQAVFSRCWLAHFRQGPAEALWRRLSR